MSRRAISIQDIARTAGVSHSTVSRALRNSPQISGAVRERIQVLAREMGYTPNAIAQSLQTQRTNTIGLVVTSVADPFWGDVVKGVEEIARPAGLSVFLSASYNDSHQEMLAIETFHRRRVDGILVAASRINSQYAERLRQIRAPTVLLNTQAEEQHPWLHSVSIDDRLGARLVVEHLLQLGHRKIGYLGVDNRPKSNLRRMEGFYDALSRAAITPPAHWVSIAALGADLNYNDAVAGRALLPDLITAGVTAIFCYNDMIAIGVLAACNDYGLSVPGDLSLAGFDDIEMAQYVVPPLTTVHQPRVELGRCAMRMLLDRIEERRVQDHVLRPTLLQRASTGVCHSE